MNQKTAAALASSILQRGWACTDSFASEQLCHELAGECQDLYRLQRLQAAKIGRGPESQENVSIRGDLTMWLDSRNATPAQGQVMNSLQILGACLGSRLYLGLGDLECQYAYYAPGRGYQKHVDAFQGCSKRVLSTVLYLNREWQTGHGRQLRIYREAEADEIETDVEPVAGRLVLMLSQGIYHEVLPAAHPRMSIAGWFPSGGLSGFPGNPGATFATDG